MKKRKVRLETTSSYKVAFVALAESIANVARLIHRVKKSPSNAKPLDYNEFIKTYGQCKIAPLSDPVEWDSDLPAWWRWTRYLSVAVKYQLLVDEQAEWDRLAKEGEED